MDPFKDLVFERARHSRTSKRKLQSLPEKRKNSYAALTVSKFKRFFNVSTKIQQKAWVEKFCNLQLQNWPGGGTKRRQVQLIPTGPLAYNTISGKTTQRGEKDLAESKLTPNKGIEGLCPVRLLEKTMAKRTSNVKTNPLFWHKNCLIGLNQISKFTRLSAENLGTDTKKARIMNHSNRSLAVSVLANSSANLQEVIK